MPDPHPTPHRATGFTLIELLAVLCIAGILAMGAYPFYRDAQLKARRANANAALLRAMQQQERYYTQHNRYAAYDGPATIPDAAFIWFSGDSASTSAYQISATACPGQRLEQCVMLSATPGGNLVDRRFSDPVCGVLTLNSRTEKSAAGLPLTTAPHVCR